MTTGATTLDIEQFSGVVAKATELSFGKLAAKFTQQKDSTISADTVELDSSARIYERLAEKWKVEYEEIAGLRKKTKASSHLQDKDIRTSDGDLYTWHPERYR